VAKGGNGHLKRGHQGKGTGNIEKRWTISQTKEKKKDIFKSGISTGQVRGEEGEKLKKRKLVRRGPVKPSFPFKPSYLLKCALVADKERLRGKKTFGIWHFGSNQEVEGGQSGGRRRRRDKRVKCGGGERGGKYAGEQMGGRVEGEREGSGRQEMEEERRVGHDQQMLGDGEK